MVQISGTGGNTEVNQGSNGINRYSMPIDTSILKPGTLNITVSQMIGDPAKGNYRQGTVKATASFMLEGTYLATDAPVQPIITSSDYIRLNAIGNRSVGDQFLITGTTSLPVGPNIMWQIMPDTGTSPTGVNMTASGDGGNNMVTKGNGTANQVSFAADMSRQVPGKWVVLVGVAKEGAFAMENPMATTSLLCNRRRHVKGTHPSIFFENRNAGSKIKNFHLLHKIRYMWRAYEKEISHLSGIVSAIILVVMFAIILLTGFFAIFSTATIDPIPDYAPGNLVVITGTTNLMAGTMLELDIVNLSSSSGTYSRVGGVDAFIVRGGGIANDWSGVLDTSSLPPGEYQVNAYATNGTGSRSNLLATARLRLTITAPNQNKIIYNFTSQGPVPGPAMLS